MKQFNNLHDAYQYQTFCPSCGTSLIQDWRKKDTLFDQCGNPETIVYFSVGDSTVGINYLTNKIEEYTEEETIDNMYSIGCNAPIRMLSHIPSGLSSSGVDIIGSSVNCLECSKYSYRLQIHICLSQKKVTNILLNSETISIDMESHDLYEIKNNYALNKTEYSVFYKKKLIGSPPAKNVTLPLMPLDLQNPQKTLDRIKGLIVFL